MGSEMCIRDRVKAPVIIGGIIPEDDQQALIDVGVARVYTPKDYEVTKIMNDVVDLVEEKRSKE